MQIVIVMIVIIVIGIQLLCILPKVFLSQNSKEASQKDYEAYIKHLSALNKQYTPHLGQIAEKLNIINYWLRTGRDPNDEATLEEQRIQEDRYQRKLMTPLEASRFEESKKRSLLENAEYVEHDEQLKSIRQTDFTVYNMDPGDVEQTEMTFFYRTDNNEYIYYCVTNEALEKKYFKNVLYFTTARPSKIPMVFPHKYDGAQMLSLYKHPAQSLWFLTNWKKIRAALEQMKPNPAGLDDTITDFDV